MALTLRLPEDIHVAIAAEAWRNHISINTAITAAIRSWLAAQQEARR